jgi:hypothetical protein
MMGACHGWFLRIGSNTVFDMVVFSSHLWRHVGDGRFGVCWCVRATASCWIVFVLSRSLCASSSGVVGLSWLLAAEIGRLPSPLAAVCSNAVPLSCILHWSRTPRYALLYLASFIFSFYLCVPQRDPSWAVAVSFAVGRVFSDVGVAGWGWYDWLPVEGAVCPFDLCLHDGRHRCNLGLPERSWKHRIVDSNLRALSMDLN